MEVTSVEDSVVETSEHGTVAVVVVPLYSVVITVEQTEETGAEETGASEETGAEETGAEETAVL